MSANAREAEIASDRDGANLSRSRIASTGDFWPYFAGSGFCRESLFQVGTWSLIVGF